MPAVPRTLGALALLLSIPLATAAEPMALDAALCDRYCGVYRLGAGHLLEISRGDGEEVSLYYGDSLDDRAGQLFAWSPTEFTAGPSLWEAEPVERRLRFVVEPDGEVSGLAWQRDSSAPVHARRVRVLADEVTIQSEGAALAATLTRPCTPGPHAAIVLVHGSGPATRSQYGIVPQRYASLGIACLVFDKRGCGQSTGQYHDFLTIDQLAADAVAGIDFLKSHGDVDSTRVGLFAASQGGWVAPVVAARRRIAFMVLRSIPVLPIDVNGLYETDNNLRVAGLTEDDVAACRQANAQFNRMVLSGGEGWEALRTTLLERRSEKWFHLAGLPDSLPPVAAPPNLRWVERLRGFMAFDPLPYWRRTTVPVLALYGGFDRNVPAEQSASLLTAALRQAGNADATVRVFPDGDHWLWSVQSMQPTRNYRRKVAGLAHGVDEWLVSHAATVVDGACDR